MTISDLIELLQIIEEKDGDVPIYKADGYVEREMDKQDFEIEEPRRMWDKQLPRRLVID